MIYGKQLEAPAAFLDNAGNVMVPLRTIAEALDFIVHWDSATQTVMLNNIISLTLGKDYYTYARMAPIELGSAPVLVDGRTYVPLRFFTDVARIDNAHVFEGQIVFYNTKEMD
jgi:hypothetical protein